MRTLNIGILAHVDAGKTSLTERLLYNAGVIKTLGSVDQGNTQTDTLTLERQRGITIKAAVTSFTVHGLKLNLIDTPGHPDFIAEVERSLRVLDAVILVLSAVEGVQPQTRILFRALQRLRIPTLIFVNKVDRMGARGTALVKDIQNKLFPQVVAMNAVADAGTRRVRVVARDRAVLTGELRTILAENNELFFDDIVNDQPKITPEACRRELIAQIRQLRVCPVFFGSATQGAGVAELTRALGTYVVPPRAGRTALSAVIFKIERGTRGEKVVYARLYSGELRAHERVSFGPPRPNSAGTAKVTGMQTFTDGLIADTTVARAGDIVKLWGLQDCAINDCLGRPPRHVRESLLVRPNLEVIVAPCNPHEAPRLYAALQQLSEQDPFVEVRRNPRDRTLSVRLCGEVQKEVIQATLANEYGLEVTFYGTAAICIERPVGVGQGLEIGDKGDAYKGTVGIRVEPGPAGSGLQYRLARDVPGTIPVAFYTAIEEAVRDTLQEGRYGWEVTDCVVTLVRTGYWPRQSHAHARFDKSMSSTAGDFRIALTPLALAQALERSGTRVCEPLNRFELDVPPASLAAVMQQLSEAEARLSSPPVSAKDFVRLVGLIPARRTFAFGRLVPDLTGGEGVFVTEFGGYQAVPGVPPTRARAGRNPFDRREYIRRTFARV